ncbi:MAG TPA: DUF302 domain-containing protein [candidate division Zixibacteria bacterium]|nr:DUF302 domain-containing protein [candidate division Zixibacteria bacterium]
MAEEKSQSKGYKISFFIGGLILGIALTGFVVAFSLPRMMIDVQESKLGFEQTVNKIQEAAIANGWIVSKVYNIQQSLLDEGRQDIGNMRVISICKPEYAEEILLDDGRKKMSAMMPCRISVYETANGKVYIAGMNLGLMSKMFGGTIEEVMKRTSKEQEQMYAPIYK